MIVSIWVFCLLGEPLAGEHGTPYVQHTASPFEHDYAPEQVEAETLDEFHLKYPGHFAIDGGWTRQQVTVMGG